MIHSLMNFRPARRSGFTLIEMLVVAVIIAVLIAILLPALNKAQQMAQRIVDANALKQLGLASTNYTSDWRGWYPVKNYDTHLNVVVGKNETGVDMIKDLLVPYAGGEKMRGELLFCQSDLLESVDPGDQWYNYDEPDPSMPGGEPHHRPDHGTRSYYNQSGWFLPDPGNAPLRNLMTWDPYYEDDPPNLSRVTTAQNNWPLWSCMTYYNDNERRWITHDRPTANEPPEGAFFYYPDGSTVWVAFKHWNELFRWTNQPQHQWYWADRSRF